MGWLSGYGYRKTVTITGQTGAGTNYQVSFLIGEDAGGDFTVPSSLSFPNDLRFTDNDKTTQLDYWIEDLTIDPVTAWVEVADSLESNVDICCYYGKAGDTTTSNGDATFPFFDTFPGVSVDNSKWTVSGVPTVAGGLVTVAYPASIRSISSFSNTYSMRTRVTDQSAVSGGAGAFSWFGTDKYDYVVYGSWPTANVLNGFRTASGLSSFSLGHNGAATYLYELRRSGTQCAVYEFQTGAPVLKGTIVGGISTSAKAFIGGDGPLFTITVDWILVRKYISPEPAFASAGAEESAPTEYVPRSGFSFFTPGVL